MQSRTAKIWLALGIVYLVWGSTYLAIRYAIGADTGDAGFPPLAMAGVRFLIAGLGLFAVTVGRPAPDRRPDPLGWPQWRAAAIVGVALLLGGNGLVVLAEQRVDSYIAAVLVAMVPLWAALLGYFRGTDRLSRAGVAGVLLGFAGVVILVNPFGASHVDIGGSLLLIGATLCWTGGSYYARTAPMPRRPLVMTAMEMISGGAALTLAGLVTGDFGRVDLDSVGASAWWAVAYLVVFGSIVAFTAYAWLLRNARLSLVTTYAYVNPVVAVILGALFLSEEITARTLLASVVIIAGVALIVTTRRPEQVAREEPGPAVGTDVPAMSTK